MKAIINSLQLSKQLSKIKPVISKTTVLPILSNVMLDFDKGRLTLKATDLETTIHTTMNCEGNKTFQTIIDFSDLSELCSKLPDQPLTISVDGKSVTVISDTGKFKFTNQFELEHFPNLPEGDFLFDMDVDADFFWAMYCSNACRSHDDLRPNMNAVCVDVKNDSVNIVGTNSFIAYKKNIPIKTKKQMEMLVSEKFITMVKSFTDCKVSISEKFMKVESDGIIVTSRFFDSKFVNYAYVFPSEEPVWNFKANRKDLISAIGLASISANLSTKTLTINFGGGNIKITSQDIDYGKEGEANIFAQSEVNFDAIGVNASQMLTLLNLLTSEDIQFSFRTPQQIIYLKPSGESNVMCLLQPTFIN